MEAQNKIISARDVLKKIERNESIECNSITIEGDLDMSLLNLPTQTIDRNKERKEKYGLAKRELNPLEKDEPIDKIKLLASKIDISNSRINGKLIFANICFQEEITFHNCQIMGDVDFSGSVFLKYADFKVSQFNENANFFQSHFVYASGFTSSEFKKEASFLQSWFTGHAEFSYCNFVGDAIFNASLSIKGISFSNSEFNGKASFPLFSSIGGTWFEGCTFRGYTNFWDSRLLGASFNESQFRVEVVFNKAQFRGNADFSKAKFREEGFFRGSKINMLTLNETKYDKLYIRWDDISDLAYDDMAYLLLIENFKKLGFFEDADNCYYQYRNKRRIILPKIYKLGDWILMALYGYGVRPLRPLMGLVIIFIAFGILYSVFEVAGSSIGDAFNTSLTVSLSGTQLIDNPNHPLTAIQYWMFSSEKLLASLFFGLFLISIGKTIIR